MERVYRQIKHAGTYNIALGVILIVTGITLGVLNLVSGGKLLKSRKQILF